MQRRTFALAATLMLAAPAFAQSFPTKPMTIVVPASPGGAIDLAARLIGQKFTEAWGQPVVIENKTGATGVIGTDFVAKAAPDGHVLALVASSHAINPSMFKKLPFDTVKSFEPVVQTHTVPLVLVVAPDSPFKTMQDVIAFGKKNPGQLSFASSGNGGAPHFSGELFQSMAGLQMQHIPYKGSTLAHPDLMSGRVSIMFDTLAATSAQIKGGKLRALAVTTRERLPALPDVPTVAQSGLPGYETSTWGGLLAPAGTPKATVYKLAAETTRILALPDVRERMLAAGVEPVGGTPEQFANFIASEMVKWGKVAKAAGIEPE
ncbi:tripartite tricarboxylate transporter substrate binding protein [Pseudorhodoferax sp. Leaf265]|jgi:tripartite-type tricarboxylate transporter receptor subunit TctC|uniref:tripartite tricarboxylate transporter substrate binding protein n=1 Tax=Pseudorhodoferax sp. Leaf265 TaxID=1736315 RepID=UPI0006F75604|nr:tripartite tricarboxylate transporter substrate binding protein [Pseudorhodoferax sp. Leaf265]KQP03562.1 ABC transporter substrate-binding protein [Pseudorhodoferax sp. Leaf265]